jgi:hypothetical protein
MKAFHDFCVLFCDSKICTNPNVTHFVNLQEYDSDEASPTSNFAEVERFQGKVVYNLDGKAYIIDSENELSLQLSDSSIIKGELNRNFNG